MTSIWARCVRHSTLTLALVGGAATAVGVGATTTAAGDDCVVVNPSASEFDRVPAMAFRMDGTAVGQLPLARAVSPGGRYADYRASTDPAVPNLIVVGDLATGQERVVTELPRSGPADRYLDGLQLSPNGEFLSYAFIPAGAALDPRLRVIDLAGNEILTTPFPVRPEDAVFSPDSSMIVYSDDTFVLGRDVWVARTDGSSPPVRILDAPPDSQLGPHAIPQNAGDFSWSPDSTRFAFEGRNGNFNGNFSAPTYEGYYVNADGSGLVQFPSVFVGGVETGQNDPIWSPDGGKIAFTQSISDGRQDIDSGLSLAVLDLSSGQISAIPGSVGFNPAPQQLDKFWSSEGSLVFNGTRNTFTEASRQDGVFSVRADGSRIRLIADYPRNGQPLDLDFIAGPIACSAVPTPTYSGVVPDRIMDTRNGTGVRQGSVGAGETISLQVAGRGGVPAAGADAVALNVTVARGSQTSFLTVFPHGVDRPTASNLNWNGSAPKASSVIVKLGESGRVDFYNESGDVHVIADVAGWFAAGSGFTAITPRRLLDTRVPIGVPSVGRLDRGTLTMRVHGDAVPASASGVVMNVTAPAVSAQSYLTVYPSGGTNPGTSNLNLFPGSTSANVVFTQIGAGGSVDIANPLGASHVIADVAGYLDAGSGFEGSAPSRIVDTRATRPLGTRGVLNVPLRGVPKGVPASARVAILNVTALRSTETSYLTVYPGDDRPTASNVNVTPGAIVPNLVLATIGTDGSVNIYNDAGQVDVLVDVLGWFS